MTDVLSWLAFGGSLASVWMYGRSPVIGPLVGILVSGLFMAYGYVSGTPAAVFSNVIFAYLHFKNYRKGRKMDWNRIKKALASGFAAVQNHAHGQSVESGWWDDVKTDEQLYDITPTKLCLVHSEISEAMEGHRKGLADDHLPHRTMFEVELADAVIRIADLAGKYKIPLGEVIGEKMEYNATRPDHRRDNRAKDGGKKY